VYVSITCICTEDDSDSEASEDSASDNLSPVDRSVDLLAYNSACVQTLSILALGSSDFAHCQM